MSAVDDITRARAALIYFHNQALQYPDNYGYSIQGLYDALQKQSAGQFLEGFGFAITESGVSEGKIRDAMERLADDGEGRLPKKWMDFFNYLSGSATTTSFIEAVQATAIGTAGDLAVGVQKIGDAVIQTGSILTGIGPYVVVGAVLFIIAMRSKQLAGA